MILHSDINVILHANLGSGYQKVINLLHVDPATQNVEHVLAHQNITASLAQMTFFLTFQHWALLALTLVVMESSTFHCPPQGTSAMTAT